MRHRSAFSRDPPDRLPLRYDHTADSLHVSLPKPPKVAPSQGVFFSPNVEGATMAKPLVPLSPDDPSSNAKRRKAILDCCHVTQEASRELKLIAIDLCAEIRAYRAERLAAQHHVEVG